MITLRPYQQTIINATLSALAKESKKGSRSVGVYAPCGSGKSILCAFMASGSAQKGNRVLILTHRAEIFKQNFSKMELMGLKVGGLNAHTVKIPDTQIVCAMAQTIKARVGNDKYAKMYKDFLASFDFVIVDEAHRSEYDALFQHFKKDVWSVGLTATWLRSGNQAQIGDFYSSIVAPVMPSELIQLGNILPSRNYTFTAPKLDDIAVDYNSGDYNQKQLRERFAKSERYSGIIENYMRICPNKKVIVFTTGAEHCISLTKEFCSAGIKAKYLLSEKFPDTHKDFSGDRSEVLKELKDGDVMVLVSVEMLSVGFDEPSIEGVILDFSTKSYTKYSQAVARADRPYLNQEFFYVLDFGNNVETYGAFESDPVISLWHKTSGGGVAPTKICSEDRADYKGKLGCGRLVPVSVMVCPWCGYQWQTDKEVYFAELELYTANKIESEMTIAQWVASKKLAGWSTQKILIAVMTKNSTNMKKAFLEAIPVLKTDKGESISPAYYWAIKKYILKK